MSQLQVTALSRTRQLAQPQHAAALVSRSEAARLSQRAELALSPRWASAQARRVVERGLSAARLARMWRQGRMLSPTPL